MGTIVLSKNCNLKDIENLITKILNDDGAVLRLPNSLKNTGIFGIEAHVIQLIITWIRNVKTKSIYHGYISEKYQQKNLQDLCSRLYGICVLSLADEILMEKGEYLKKSISLESAVKSITSVRAEKFKEAFKGPYVGLPCIKASGNKTELNSPLYNGEKVVGPDKFEKITSNIIDSIVSGKSKKDILAKNVIKNLSEILRELFTNTHKHARRDIHGNYLEKSFRGIIINSSSLTKERLDELLEARSGAMMGFGAEWMSEIKKKPLPLLDISIVDSGPGFACRWKGVGKIELSEEDERQAVVDCFRKHYTTDQMASSGSGLTNVLRDVRQLKGWFRLRTGRSLVEKSFFNPKTTIGIGTKDIRMMNDFAEGAVINIIIPLVVKRQK